MRATMFRGLAFLSLAVPFMSPAPADAAPKTFVASNGGGAACTRVAPCATFQAAHDVTDAGGEIICIDSANYLPVGINRSITIDCTGTNATIVDNGGIRAIGIDQPGAVVTLRGLTLQGMGTAPVGIIFVRGSMLKVENCRIIGFRGGSGSVDGRGISFSPLSATTSTLFVADSVITDNGLAASGGGIIVQPVSSGSALVTIERTRVEDNTYGIFANGFNGTGVVSVQIHDTVAAGSAFHGISAYTRAGNAITSVTVNRSSSIGNDGNGIWSEGAGAFVSLIDSTVISNGAGLSATDGGRIISYQNNQLTGNGIEAGPSAVQTLK